MTTVLIRIRNLGLGVVLSGALLPSVLMQEARAEVSLATVEDYTSFPVIITQSATPLVMLAMSRDHQYWFKAYNDYTDLDPKKGDGIETTYKHSIDYFGYFDPYKCYQHVNGRFEPKGWSPSDPANAKYCDAVNGDWSGNFLNWATMSRMDIVRKILYGGKRSTDTSTSTVLERAHLPSDAHSFVKYYAGDDISRLTPFSPQTQSDIALGAPPQDVGISICNSTEDWGDTPVSQTTTKPPLIRVAEGNFSLWASNERWQCRWGDDAGLGWTSTPDRDSTNANDPAKSGIPAHPDNPLRGSHGLGNNDYVARVLVCDDDFYANNKNEDGARATSPDTDRADNCAIYPDGNAKPVGLLQEFGEDERIHFGLMTGSWQNNISGGVLRRNVGPLDEEINADTDGTFVPPKTGKDAGIITTLDRIRVYGYRYDDGTYRRNEGDNCTFQLASITEGDCTAWGNPISELYLEALRYFAGKADPTSAFELTGAGDHFSLPKTAWLDPIDADNACARLNTVVFNASVSSYDNDQMSSDLAGSPDFAALTDQIGDAEGITGTKAFIGRNGTDNDELCGPKTVNGLGRALGLCPEAPTVLGSYQMAGAAWHGHTTDLRGDLNGEQNVTAYAVALSTTVPKIRIPLDPTDPDSRAVTILPAYRNLKDPSAPGGGALVDFKIVQPNTEVAPGVYAGKFYVNWEDSEQGGDYDQDMWGVLDYMLDTNAGTITVTTESIAESTSTPQLFGFVISGTTQDGFHAYSGIEGVDFTDPTGVLGCNDCYPSVSGAGAGTGQSGPQSYTFNLGPASAELLPSPLFFAAKWGGFVDTNDNGKPDKVEEWDAKDNDTGAEGADGLPDNYFFVTNPRGLQRSLRAVFKAIVARTASGTAAAVVANTQTGSGAAYQALYEPLTKDDDGNEVEWIGNLHALWVDQFGLLREDNPGGTPNGKLDDYNTDPVVDIFFDEDDRKTKLRRFSSSDNLEFIEASSTEHKLTDLSPIWSARDQLSPEPDFVDVTQQRTYSSAADDGRYVFTWIDKNLDGDIDSGEQVDLERANIGPGNFGYFDVATEAEAEDLVDYIRGAEVANHRPRVVDVDDDGDTEIMRLGDIIHSTPTPVGAPSEALDVLFADLSYAKFRKQYVARRQVVYVGANDGMLHAFNAGFFDSATQEFKKQLNGETPHPLGSELWAYVPRNLLPHLKWLKDPNYTHVYYVDGKPRVFDAKVFPADATHPDGWGTVLIVGFRLGGGDLTTDTAGDGLGGNDADGNNADDVTMLSAYVVLDITDPEQPPQVLAEITHPNLEYTTVYPAVAYFQATNKWYLVFGSGPNDLATGTSDQNAYLYAYNMRAGVSGVEIDLLNGFARNVSTISQGFMGNPLIVDWDLDGDADDLYFGVVEGGTQNPGGHLRKLVIDGVDKPGSWPQSKKILTTGQPFLARPTSTADERGRHWIYASSGRLLVNGDKNDSKQQTLYGLIDGPPNTFALNGTEQVDTSDAVVYADETVSDVIDPDGDSITNFTELVQEVEEAGGWKYDYETNSADPSQRGIVDSALTGGILFNPAFTPGNDLCNSEGKSELLGFFFKTGTPLPSPTVFGSVCSDGSDSCPDNELISLPSVDLGSGLASSPSIHAGAGHGSQEVSVVEQTSTGAIVLEKATTASGVLSGEVSWREHSD
ncbi:MAG: hypothetical protein GWN84_25195 [Gammaproteobacteria bacterium]|nr:hypothetical protein [Gammaproteobacteria bacterium]NIR85844.1 hypothetical protein [Gammaproteobacteria bacterium]NIR90600.1 hypothetical protein [Gammaproteobacteria bacterium]NIU06979.1 hypothetical protein [Gammaproteobacteria bacterium]NIV75892.1 hypothetical protein [Gammaproteobacteria bacterium]